MTTKRFWTSDLHFGHQTMVTKGWRPFASVEEMNEALISRWNAVVGPEDHVMVLGDVVMGQKVETLPLIARLNGTKFLVPGNHDPVHPGNPATQRDKWTPEFAKLFTILPHAVEANVGGHEVQVNHFPFFGDHKEEDRMTEWRPVPDGRWLLSGHMHGANGRVQADVKTIDVGVDANGFAPLSDEQIAEIIQQAENG